MGCIQQRPLDAFRVFFLAGRKEIAVIQCIDRLWVYSYFHSLDALPHTFPKATLSNGTGGL
jgi:hypothetical protein